MEDFKAIMTPMSATTTLDTDEEGEQVDQKEYWSMIGSLLYLTATRLYINLVCVYGLSFKLSHGQRIGKPSRGFTGTCDTLQISIFGTSCHLLWLFMVFQIWISPSVI
jgi:hypothetical protein